MQSSFLGTGLRSSGASTRAAAPGGRVSSAAAPRIVAHYGGKANLGGGKAWERTKVNDNGNPVKVKLHVKAGDVVKVIAGKDKGTVAEVEKVMPNRGLIVVKGVNKHTRNIAPRTKEEQGQQKTVETPIHHSNVMHYSVAKQVASRIGIRVAADGSKVRYLKKTGEEVPDRSFRLAKPEAAAPAAEDSSSSGGDSSSSSSGDAQPPAAA